MNFLLIGLGVLIALSFGTSDFLSKGLTAKISAYKTTVYILALSGIGTLFPGLFLKSSAAFSPFPVLLLVFIATATYVSFAALYRAYSRGMLSLTAPIVNSYPAFSVILSVLLIGASFSPGAIGSPGRRYRGYSPRLHERVRPEEAASLRGAALGARGRLGDNRLDLLRRCPGPLLGTRARRSGISCPQSR